MAGRGGLRALRERFSMHEWAPPTAGVNFVVWGLNRGPAMAHRIGMGEPCLPMEEQRGWSPGQEDPSCLQWDSSLRRTDGSYRLGR